MTDSLAEEYLRWLAPQIRDEQYTQDQEYWDLLSIMFEKEFEWLVPNDDNRLVDGLDLRAEFCFANHIHTNALESLGQCSFLEVLIGLSRRLAFAARGSAHGWAWQLIVNLELNEMSDPLTKRKVRKVDDILDTVIWRTYNPDGTGGFFPLAWPDEDQTKKELWYQMAAYIDELHPGH
jgi:hypothetical protein